MIYKNFIKEDIECLDLCDDGANRGNAYGNLEALARFIFISINEAFMTRLHVMMGLLGEMSAHDLSSLIFVLLFYVH